MFGIDRFQAIINPPEAAVLAIGRIIEIPWQTVDGFELRSIVNMHLSIDHRAMDGATAAPFLNDIRVILGDPAQLFQMD
jgi:pyruvate dehydrogenase E2 component (dihydrolipoamide acetyltransferase)